MPSCGGTVPMNTNVTGNESVADKDRLLLQEATAAQPEGPTRAQRPLLGSSGHSVYTQTLPTWEEFIYCHPLALNCAPVWLWRGVLFFQGQCPSCYYRKATQASSPIVNSSLHSRGASDGLQVIPDPHVVSCVSLCQGSRRHTHPATQPKGSSLVNIRTPTTDIHVYLRSTGLHHWRLPQLGLFKYQGYTNPANFQFQHTHFLKRNWKGPSLPGKGENSQAVFQRGMLIKFSLSTPRSRSTRRIKGMSDHLPGTVITTIRLWGGHYDYSHFMDEKTEA